MSCQGQLEPQIASAWKIAQNELETEGGEKRKKGEEWGRRGEVRMTVKRGRKKPELRESE